MRILFVAPYPSSPIRIRSYGFVKQLMKQHEVSVVALCSTRHEMQDVVQLQQEGISITAVEDRPIWKVLRVLKAWGSQLPLQVAFDASPAFRLAIETQLRTGHFDVLHIEFIRALGALPDVSIPLVWDAVDCISQLYESGASIGATPLLRLIGRGEAQRTRVYERLQLQRFREVLVTSERDRQELLKLAHPDTLTQTKGTLARITVLPHGIDPHYFQPYRGQRQPATLVFSGKMSFHANVAGIQHFVQDILPLIWQERPDVRLVIAGSAPSAEIQHLARDQRIVVTGYVPDLRPHIAQAQVAISPLPYAVGIQNKVLEAMALGTPVVASSSAVAGLQAVDGQHILVADHPQKFAAAVLHLLDDRALWQTISEQGLDYVSTYHNWEQIIDRLVTVYTRALHTSNEAPAMLRNDSSVACNVKERAINMHSLKFFEVSQETIGEQVSQGKDTVHDTVIYHAYDLPLVAHEHSWRYRLAKRAIDVCGALVGLALLTILLPIIALLVLYEDRGPLFYKQVRVGKDGQPFTLYKIRTMVADADAYLARHPELQAAWQATGKLLVDPRITRIGHFLRRTSLDELPQMFNVLCGDISLVGPRPIQFSEIPFFGELLDFRQKVKPGLSGLWQISGRSTTDYEQRVILDCTYVVECTFWIDLMILLKTPAAVLHGHGAY